MFLSRILRLLLAVFAIQATCQPPGSIVAWDEYSLLINGERVFIFSGEFHYERLPVPELWRDVLEKYKSNGLNAVSVCMLPRSFSVLLTVRLDLFLLELP